MGFAQDDDMVDTLERRASLEKDDAQADPTTLSGKADTVEGNHRYSRMKNERSPSVSRIRPRTFRRKMTS